MASHLRLPLSEVMQRVSYRESLLWDRYFDEQWEVPSPTDYYIMQLTAVVASIMNKNPSRIKVDDFRIRLKKRGTVEDATKAAKLVWAARLGMTQTR